jgi:cytochrome c553
MMARDQGPFRLDNPWPKIGWWSAAAGLATAIVLGFLILPRFQENGPILDTWTAICSALGITSDSSPASEPQPPVRIPTQVVWSQETRTLIASGDKKSGAFVALNCGACHGEQGVSKSNVIPTLAGMDAAVVYKQLDDYGNGKRLWGVMNGIASALTPQNRADVATYLASLSGGLRRFDGNASPEPGRSLRQTDPAMRLIFAGDPHRGVPACSACHGPGGRKLGAPVLVGQHPEYIERQLLAFAQGMRQNDMNQQMRIIAAQLTTEEIHAIAVYYSAEANSEVSQK